MAVVERTVRLAAPPGDVWSFITDPANFAAYVDGYAHGRVTTTHATDLGARYDWAGALGPLRLHATEEIVAWEPGRHVGYAGALGGVAFRSAMTVAPIDGGSALTIRIEHDLPFAWLGRMVDLLLIRPLVRRSIARSATALRRRWGTP